MFFSIYLDNILWKNLSCFSFFFIMVLWWLSKTISNFAILMKNLQSYHLPIALKNSPKIRKITMSILFIKKKTEFLLLKNDEFEIDGPAFICKKEKIFLTSTEDWNLIILQERRLAGNGIYLMATKKNSVWAMSNKLASNMRM